MINFHTVNGIVSVPEPPGFDWEEIINPKIEGTLYYKGFIAQYNRGREEDGEGNHYVADMANIHEAAFVMEGDSLEELTEDFHFMVDDFLEEVSRGGYGGQPIEYYTDDPAILSYYTSHYRDRGIDERSEVKCSQFDLETMLTIQRAILKLESA
jgi:hypothetical protein